jgi:hypothetical protein
MQTLRERPAAVSAVERKGGAGATATLLWVGGVVLTLALLIFVAWAFRGQPGDDPYITYRYAYNLAHGNGFVYNVGERVQSTTTPLYTLLLAGAGLAGLDIPTAGYYLSIVALLGHGVCCVGFVVAAGLSRWIGLGTVALTFASPVTPFGLGAEMPLLMVLAWGSWWAAAEGRWHIAALLAAFATVTRGDGVLVGAALALVYLYVYRKVSPRRWPWSAALIYLLLAIPWYIFAWLYFGSPLPATLGAKQAQGAAEGAATFLEGLLLFWRHSFGALEALWLPALFVMAAGVGTLLWRRGWLLLPVVWATLFIGGFALLGVPRYPWYYSPLVPMAALALILGGGMLGAALVRRYRVRNAGQMGLFWGSILVLLLAGAPFLLASIEGRRLEPVPRYRLYMQVGDWLAQNTPPEVSVGAEEVGLLGYHSQRRIIDFVGLIQPEVAPRRAAGDNLWAVQTYSPDYIVAFPPWLAAVGGDPWVRERYITLRTFEVPGADVATLLKKR